MNDIAIFVGYMTIFLVGAGGLLWLYDYVRTVLTGYYAKGMEIRELRAENHRLRRELFKDSAP